LICWVGDVGGLATYEEALDGAAETCGRGGLAVFAAFDAFGGQGESSGAHVVWWFVEWVVGSDVVDSMSVIVSED